MTLPGELPPKSRPPEEARALILPRPEVLQWGREQDQGQEPPQETLATGRSGWFSLGELWLKTGACWRHCSSEIYSQPQCPRLLARGRKGEGGRYKEQVRSTSESKMEEGTAGLPDWAPPEGSPGSAEATTPTSGRAFCPVSFFFS